MINTPETPIAKLRNQLTPLCNIPHIILALQTVDPTKKKELEKILLESSEQAIKNQTAINSLLTELENNAPVQSPNKLIAFIKYRLLGRCEDHGWFLYPKKFAMKTKYAKHEDNYMIGCKYCKADSDAYYQELWDDYNRSRL